MQDGSAVGLGLGSGLGLLLDSMSDLGPLRSHPGGPHPTPAHRAWSTWAPAAACTATWQPGTSWWKARRTSRSPTSASPSCCLSTKTTTWSASQARAPSSGRGLLPAPPFLRTTQAAPPLELFGSRPASRGKGGPLWPRPHSPGSSPSRSFSCSGSTPPWPCSPSPLRPPRSGPAPAPPRPRPSPVPAPHSFGATSHPTARETETSELAGTDFLIVTYLDHLP